jgi:hypothetical protein
MCFSATASFVTAGVTGAVGIATLMKVSRAQEIPLAAFPLIFAAQQTAEGLLWLTLPAAPGSAVASELTQVFLILSLLFWPIFAPFAAYAAEPEPLRRRVIIGCLAAGLLVAGYFLATVIPTAPAACISGGHIQYGVSQSPLSVGGLYLIATAGALCISSIRAVALLGWIIFIGSVASYLLYWDAFLSVWCFFAAGASVVLLLHFESRRVARAASIG